MNRYFKQLKPGGTLIIPVGDRYFGQALMVVHKDNKGRLTQKNVLPVAFVPLIASPGD